MKNKIIKLFKFIVWVLNPFSGASFIDRIMPPGGKRRLEYDKKQTEKLYRKRVENYYKLTDGKTAKYWEGIDHRKYLVYEKSLEKAKKNELTNYEKWYIQNDINDQEYEKQRKFKFKKKPKISIVIPLYNTNIDFFRELLYSVHLQTYKNWELCLADGSKEKLTEIEEMCQNDNRIKYKFLDDNKGIAGNTNEAIKMATGEYIAFLDHDDMLSLDALFEVVNAINKEKYVDFVYSNEDKFHFIDEPRFTAHFKPDYAPDTLRANNYICHLSVVKKKLLDEVGLLNNGYDGAQDYDLILRITEKAQKIVHIPKVLYHWRVHKDSTAMLVDAKPYAFEAGKRAIKSHLERVGLKGNVVDGINTGTYVVDYDINEESRVQIIIVNYIDNLEIINNCLNSIRENTTLLKYEICILNLSSKDLRIEGIKIISSKEEKIGKALNEILKDISSDYVVLLDSNLRVLTHYWLKKLLGYAQMEDVACVGAKIYYDDKTVKNAGIALNKGNGIIELFNGFVENEYGYFARESLIQDLNAVSGECMAFRKNVAIDVGLFSEEYTKDYYDIDFCLKCRKNKKLNVYYPYVKLECISKNIIKKTNDEDKNIFLVKWSERLEEVDEYAIGDGSFLDKMSI